MKRNDFRRHKILWVSLIVRHGHGWHGRHVVVAFAIQATITAVHHLLSFVGAFRVALIKTIRLGFGVARGLGCIVLGPQQTFFMVVLKFFFFFFLLVGFWTMAIGTFDRFGKDPRSRKLVLPWGLWVVLGRV